ncbi:putative secreted protein [Wickerhamomyces ciferrii]|uniref:Secreted protein n=1 Tax=Wickerhamomyces ciferrii (strain ATCC 14091 / BCRC 22168 / CBS 111 / JCM 3599 / NBRC 0793 / NRRL Y-1031 F-60-10) TaxID=1206466 RepID=K0KVS1_WICCF|nr:uncharacterized protein BN7_5645 [Wickerhamomyces ciferrii]CCH46057.1 putative secreted protein [Wickerhamomyces ciferrii]
MKLLYTIALAMGASAAIIESISIPTVTPAPKLNKRYKKVRVPDSTTSSSTTEIPKPWVRTIYSSVREIVTPTVIEGVTFSGKPSTETDKALPWISLNGDGSPKTIKPQIKNGQTKKASPDYSTYFQTATTVTYNYEDLKAHNMDPDTIHEEVEWIPEDQTYVSLNPLIRCTPDRYYKKGLAKNIESAPFCTPKEGSQLKLGKTYFITWFSRFYPNSVEKVRIHLSYVKESIRDKGMHKRDVESAFFTSEWIENIDGYYPLEIQEDWLLGKFEQQVGISIQPESIPDDEFNLLKDATVFKILKGPKVAKKNKETRKLEDEGISDDSAYYIMMSIPSVVAVAAIGMYIFVWITGNDRDITKIKQKALSKRRGILGKFKGNKNNRKYSELPQNKDDIKTS